MIPRVTIPASGSGQIRREGQGAGGEERQRRREREKQRGETDYSTDDLLDFANVEGLIRYPRPLVDHARRTGKPRETTERRDSSVWNFSERDARIATKKRKYLPKKRGAAISARKKLTLAVDAPLRNI